MSVVSDRDDEGGVGFKRYVLSEKNEPFLPGERLVTKLAKLDTETGSLLSARQLRSVSNCILH